MMNKGKDTKTKRQKRLKDEKTKGGIISLFSKVIKKNQRETEHPTIRVINPSNASCDFPYVSKIQFSIFCVWQTPDF